MRTSYRTSAELPFPYPDGVVAYQNCDRCGTYVPIFEHGEHLCGILCDDCAVAEASAAAAPEPDWSPFTSRTLGAGTPCRPVRCYDCQLPNDRRVSDFSDGRAECDACRKVSYAKYNAVGRMFR